MWRTLTSLPLLLCLLKCACAARGTPLLSQRLQTLTSSGEPPVEQHVHVPAGDCTAVPTRRTTATQRYIDTPSVALQGEAGRGCAAADFSVRRLASGDAVPTACASLLQQLTGNDDASSHLPRWLVRSSCSSDAVVALQPPVFSGPRRALQQTPVPPQKNPTIATQSCTGPNCKVFILIIITFGVIAGAIVTVSVMTKCGPCKFCLWAWRHRHDPPELAAHNAQLACKGNPVEAAQLISEIVGPCTGVQREKLGECPVCLTNDEAGSWSLLPCNHAICNACLAQLVKAQAMVTKCPLCRDQLLPDVPEQEAGSSAPGSILTTVSTDASSSGGGAVSPSSSMLSRASTRSQASSEVGAADAAIASDGGGGAAAGAEAPAGADPGGAIQLTSIPETSAAAIVAIGAPP